MASDDESVAWSESEMGNETVDSSMTRADDNARPKQADSAKEPPNAESESEDEQSADFEPHHHQPFPPMLRQESTSASAANAMTSAYLIA